MVTQSSVDGDVYNTKASPTMDIKSEKGDTVNMVKGLSGLLSSRSTNRLEQIANLRARGIGDYIDLPQLVVCGDQSAGKSSVLEGITGIPFPRQDGVCTKFATDIILEHSLDELLIKATILPHSFRLEEEKEALRGFKMTLNTFDDLPAVISKAGALMGLRGFDGRTEGPAFGMDILRIHVSGPTGLHLSVVDLPGLIENPSEEQTESDRDTVHKLVDMYLETRKTIILAVVQAGNDIANQPIIRKAKLQDRSGDRTVGIITKPDLINVGTEVRIAILAKNQDTTKLKLGYFIVKNPAPKDLEEGITMQQRLQHESAFFASSPWKEQGLDPKRTGIVSLKSFLQSLFNHHVEQELPKVREEIQSLLQRTRLEIEELGDPRTTPAHCRAYLLKLSMHFNRLCSSALNGTYQEADADFFDSDDPFVPRRFRSEVHTHNANFAAKMEESGKKRKVIDENIPSDGQACTSTGQMLVTEEEMKAWVKKIYRSSRGKELPGTYNYALLSELFRNQSRPWKNIAESHIELLSSKIENFVKKVLAYFITNDQTLAEITEIATEALSDRKAAAETEFTCLMEDEKQQPITYNSQFTKAVQNSRLGAVQKVVQRASPNYEWNTIVPEFMSTLKENIEVNMEQQACGEALAALEAYYEVNLKIFIDNVCRQVIERHLLRDLPNIFSPETVAAMEDDELMRIAGESPTSIMKRKELEDLHLQLTRSLKDLKK